MSREPITLDEDPVATLDHEARAAFTAVFREGTDPFRARQVLAEQLGTMEGGLPEGVEAPKLTPLTSATMDLLKIGLMSDRLSLMELRTFAEWTVAPRLRAVPGVSSVVMRAPAAPRGCPRCGRRRAARWPRSWTSG